MGEENAGLFRGPFQNDGIIRACQTGVLQPHNIDGRITPQNAADNIVVEVLVGGEFQHDDYS
jgi:hypothetical protein